MTITTLKTLAVFDPYWKAQPSSVGNDQPIRRISGADATYNKRALFIVQKITIALQIIGVIGFISLQFLSAPIYIVPIAYIADKCSSVGLIGTFVTAIWGGMQIRPMLIFNGRERNLVVQISEYVSTIFQWTSYFLGAVSVTLIASLWPARVWINPDTIIPAVFCSIGAMVLAVVVKMEFSRLSEFLAKQRIST